MGRKATIQEFRAVLAVFQPVGCQYMQVDQLELCLQHELHTKTLPPTSQATVLSWDTTPNLGIICRKRRAVGKRTTKSLSVSACVVESWGNASKRLETASTNSKKVFCHFFPFKLLPPRTQVSPLFRCMFKFLSVRKCLPWQIQVSLRFNLHLWCRNSITCPVGKCTKEAILEALWVSACEVSIEIAHAYLDTSFSGERQLLQHTICAKSIQSWNSQAEMGSFLASVRLEMRFTQAQKLPEAIRFRQVFLSKTTMRCGNLDVISVG